MNWDHALTEYQEGMLAALKICENYSEAFKAPRYGRYAGESPLKYPEAFACAVCADAIRTKAGIPEVAP